MKKNMAAEKQLLKRARSFDQHALTEIYDQYSPMLYRYAIRLLGDSDYAEECVAETFSRFLKVIKRGGGPRENLKAYLYRVAHNWITDQYRSQPALMMELDENLKIDPEPGPYSNDVLLKEQVRSALMRLTSEQRQVIILKFIEGWSNAEVARAMRKKVGAVKSLQHRALSMLNRLLRDLYE
jgi:RNA polymerase sigma-70 factor (ECF subfamily)